MVPYVYWRSFPANVRCHTAAVPRQFLEEVGISTLDWPAHSPELNPIEHMWDELKKWVRRRCPAPASIEDLKTAFEKWQEIPEHSIRKLIRFMKNRLQAVIRARRRGHKYSEANSF